MSLIFVDVEAYGGSPVTGRMTEFGAVEFKSRDTFHGWIETAAPDPSNPAVPRPIKESSEAEYNARLIVVMADFLDWLNTFKSSPNSRLIFVSDNPAFDWQWINCAFWKTLGRNPFGHSARRIGDFYAGLVGDFYGGSSKWKGLRQTPHDHNPVNDAMGNVEAFARMLAGERV